MINSRVHGMQQRTLPSETPPEPELLFFDGLFEVFLLRRGCDGCVGADRWAVDDDNDEEAPPPPPPPKLDGGVGNALRDGA